MLVGSFYFGRGWWTWIPAWPDANLRTADELYQLGDRPKMGILGMVVMLVGSAIPIWIWIPCAPFGASRPGRYRELFNLYLDCIRHYWIAKTTMGSASYWRLVRPAVCAVSKSTPCSCGWYSRNAYFTQYVIQRPWLYSAGVATVFNHLECL